MSLRRLGCGADSGPRDAGEASWHLLHRRWRESLRRLIVFCGDLTEDELRRPLTGFGFFTVLGQLEHTIGADVYWQTVVTRGYAEEATLPTLRDVAAIEAFRQQTASATRSYLERASEAELNSPREMISDPGETRLRRAVNNHMIIEPISYGKQPTRRDVRADRPAAPFSPASREASRRWLSSPCHLR